MTTLDIQLTRAYPSSAPQRIARTNPHTVTVRMSPELHEKLVELSCRSDWSMNRICVAMLEDGVRKLEGGA